MTADPDGPGVAGAEPVAEPVPGAPNGGPGSTRIAGRVVERIATRTVAGLDRATGSSRHLLGVRVGSLTADTPARVDATVDGEVATVRVSMAIRWPESVRQVTRQAREKITEDVTRWTGLRVAQVDIAVPELLRGPVEPALDQPAPVEPTPVEPAAGDAAAGDEAAGQGAPGESSAGQPGIVDPAPVAPAGVH